MQMIDTKPSTELQHTKDKPCAYRYAPEDSKKGILTLALALVRLLHELLERQAIRRVEKDSLNEQQVEQVGIALMKQRDAIRQLCADYDISEEDLNLDLGPLGKLF